MPLTSGETFAGFRIVRLLGSGRMGEVYLAEHPRLPRRDAVKVLPADVSAVPDYRPSREEDFTREHCWLASSYGSSNRSANVRKADQTTLSDGGRDRINAELARLRKRREHLLIAATPPTKFSKPRTRLRRQADRQAGGPPTRQRIGEHANGTASRRSARHAAT